MSAKANHFKIGVFVLIALALCVAAIVTFGAGTFFREEVLAETYIDESVQGLEIGAAVRYRGVKVGKVTEITFAHIYYEERDADEASLAGANTRYVLVRFNIYPDIFTGQRTQDFAQVLNDEIKKKGLRCSLGSQGLTGMLYIEVDYIDVNAPELSSILHPKWGPEAPYYYIPSIKSKITRMSDAVENIMEKIDRVLLKIEGLQIEPIVTGIDTLIGQLNTAVNDANLSGIRAEAIELVDNLTSSSQAFQNLLNKPQIDQILTGVSDTVTSSAATIEEVRALLRKPEINAIINDASMIVQDARAIVEQTRQKAETVLENLATTSANITSTTASINRLFADDQLPDAAEHLKNTLERLDTMIQRQRQSVESILENIEETTEDIKNVGRDMRQHPAGSLWGNPPPPTELEKKK